MRAAVPALVLTLITACAVGPDYVKPKIDTPQEYRFADKDVKDSADTEWWKRYDDPVLNQLITEALKKNYNVKIAAANVEQSAGVLTQTRSQFFPQVNYSAEATRQRVGEIAGVPINGRVIQNPATTYTVLAGASWEIDLWGRIRRLTEAARANLLATEEAQRGVVLSLVTQVAGTYLQLRGLDAQLVIANRTLASYGQTVKIFELQYKYGRVSKMTVEQARSSYETAAAAIPQIESQIAQTEDGLSVLIGRNPEAIPRGKTIEAMGLPPVPAGVPSQLLERRPDIAQAEQSLIAANAQIGAAKALYFPTISLTGAFGNQSTDLSKLFSGPSTVWNIGGQVTGPIFTGGAIKGQVAQATAVQESALNNYKLTVQNAFSDVENALVARQKLLVQQAAQERLVKALSEYERLATLQYNGGYAPYSTVLQAQEQLFPQELQLAQTRFEVHNALVNLYKATGGGWIDIAGKMADPPALASQTAKANKKQEQ